MSNDYIDVCAMYFVLKLLEYSAINLVTCQNQTQSIVNLINCKLQHVEL